MGFIHYNPNPDGKYVGDCIIRALTILLNDTWDNVYIDLSMVGFYIHDMQNSNAVWGEYLKLNGFKQYPLPDTCPNCYTVKQFCIDFPEGVYMVATGSHVVAVIDGNYYDTGDSGNEVPIYYWRKER